MNHSTSLCFLVPSFNRVEKLRVTINSMLDFSTRSTLNVHIFIVNNCSSDATLDLLKEYSGKYKNITYLNRDEFYGSEKSISSIFQEAPLGYDYYWLFGNDDTISKDASSHIDHVLTSRNYGYIHVSESEHILNWVDYGRRAEDLANSRGFLSVYSFLSSQIVSYRALKKACDILNSGFTLDKQNIFQHSYLLYEATCSEVAKVIGHPIVHIQPDRYAVPEDTGGPQTFYNWVTSFLYLKNLHNSDKKYPLGFFVYDNKIVWRWFYTVFIGASISKLDNHDDFLTYCDFVCEGLNILKFIIDQCSDTYLCSLDRFVIEISIIQFQMVKSIGNRTEHSNSMLISMHRIAQQWSS